MFTLVHKTPPNPLHTAFLTSPHFPRLFLIFSQLSRLLQIFAVRPYFSPLLFCHSSWKTGRRFLLTCSVIEWLGSARAKMACTAPHCTALHNTALHSIASHCTEQYCTSLHITALHSTAHHCTTQYCTSLHCTVLHITAPQSTARHYPLFCTGQSR